MSRPTCKSTIFPCPAGARCPEHAYLLDTIKKKDYKTALELITKQKQNQPGSPLSKLKPAKPLSEDAVKLRDGIISAASRTYGESYIEPVIRKILNLDAPLNGDHDAYDPATQEKYEIKSSKILMAKETGTKRNKVSNLFDTIAEQAQNVPLTRMVSYSERTTTRYDANIQNVKRDHFDNLICVLLFEEGMEILKYKKDQVSRTNIKNWSDKHGRYDQLGKSGQFNINRGNIEEHEKNASSAEFFTWEELVPFFKDLHE